MPTFRLKAIEVTAVQWNGPQDNPAVRALCDHYASLDHANPYVTENSGARYLFSGDWVVDLSDVTGLCGKIGRYGVFRPNIFDELFEPAAGKLIPPQGGSSSAPPTCDPSTLPRGRSSTHPAPIVEYRIISKTNSPDVANEVNRLLAEGWELYGHIVPDARFWIQPMVRRHDARPPADPVVPLTKAGDRAGAV